MSAALPGRGRSARGEQPLGEFALIRRLQAVFATDSPRADLLVGIGDDAAVWRAGMMLHLATTDTMVEGVHFDLAWCTAEDVGWKALATNCSDVSAMGGTPRYALCTIGVPPNGAQIAEAVGRGAATFAAGAGAAIVGGDIVASPSLFVSFTVVGETAGGADWPNRLMLRSAARPGDVLAVTGPLGGAAAALAALLADMQPIESAAAALHRPNPPLALGPRLVGLGVRCGMDISDGLAGDLAKICEASRLDGHVDVAALPIHPGAAPFSTARALELATSGGEDYELLFTASARCWKRILASGIPAIAIGEMRPGPGRVVFSDGVQRTGWDHLA